MNLVIACLRVVIKFASVALFSHFASRRFWCDYPLSLWCRTAKCCLMLLLGPPLEAYLFFDAFSGLAAHQAVYFKCQLSFPGVNFGRNAGTGYSWFCCTGDLWLTSTLAVIGWLGLVITVELDASWAAGWGSVVQAIYGRKTAGRTTVATLMCWHSRLCQSYRFVLGNCNSILTTRFGASEPE